MFSPQTTKYQYLLSPRHWNSIFSVPGALKMNIFCSQITNSLLTHRLSLIPRYFNTKFLSGPQNQLFASMKIISISLVTRSFLIHHQITVNHPPPCLPRRRMWVLLTSCLAAFLLSGFLLEA